MAIVAGGGRIVALQTIGFLQIAAVDNILVVGLPPIQWAVVFGGWQARVKIDRQRAFPILDGLFHVLRIKSDDRGR